jgi:Glycosyl hydrolase family 71
MHALNILRIVWYPDQRPDLFGVESLHSFGLPVLTLFLASSYSNSEVFWTLINFGSHRNDGSAWFPHSGFGDPDNLDCKFRKVLSIYLARSNERHAYAHFIVGNTYNYTQQFWQGDIANAQDLGIDAFALNLGPDIWQVDQVADAYEAAASRSNYFSPSTYLSIGLQPASSVFFKLVMDTLINSSMTEGTLCPLFRVRLCFLARRVSMTYGKLKLKMSLRKTALISTSFPLGCRCRLIRCSRNTPSSMGYSVGLHGMLCLRLN